MTDAAVSVTQSAVERFTEQYLRSLGCGIKIHEDRWEVTVPEGADTALSSGGLTLVPADGSTEEERAEPLHPESALFQQILSEAGERCRTGTLSIKTEDTEIEIPAWLENSVVKVDDTRFIPYYDRTAVVFLFKVSIETVSEYQREVLRAIALDTRSEEGLPKLAEVFLRLTSLERNSTTSNQSELEKSDVRSLLDPARDQLLERIQELVDKIHENASRAADEEVEEYRQMQQQRIEELEEERSDLRSKINKLSETINKRKQEERVRALKERKDLKSKYNEIDAELSELRERRDQGFPVRQREIRERHALNVRTIPLTVTQVEYERGEIEIDLKGEEAVQTVTAGYGSGVGMTGTVQCSSCNRELSDQNPPWSIKGGLRCTDCAPADSR